MAGPFKVYFILRFPIVGDSLCRSPGGADFRTLLEDILGSFGEGLGERWEQVGWEPAGNEKYK